MRLPMLDIDSLASNIATLQKFVAALKKQKINPDFFQRVIDDVEFRQWCVETINGKLDELCPPKSVHPEPTVIDVEIEVDDTLDFDQAKALGKYKWVNDNATAEWFPIVKGTGKRRVKAKLVCFHRRMGDEEENSEVNNAVATMKCKRGGTAELLAVGAQHPKIQCSKLIVSGAFWTHPGGDREFLGLEDNDVRRVLSLLWVRSGDQWRAGVWFFVVPQE